VTLIAALPCHNAVVLCADSQETIERYRCSRQKITAERMGFLGQFAVVIAGAGYSHIIDAFVLCLRDRFAQFGSSDLDEFRRIVENEIRNFRKDELVYHPRSHRYLDIIIAAVSTEETYGAWTVKASKLQPISNEAVIVGWNVPFYLATLKQFYNSSMSISQAVLAGIRVLTIAENTSNDVRGPMSVAVLSPAGVCMEPSGIITAVQRHLGEFAKVVDRAFLVCADSGLYISQLKELLAQFSDSAMRLHKQHLVGLLRSIMQNERAIDLANLVYPRIPPGLSMEMDAGTFDDILLPGEKEYFKQKFIEANERQEAKLNAPSIPAAAKIQTDPPPENQT
jgi:hypothetical protein